MLPLSAEKGGGGQLKAPCKKKDWDDLKVSAGLGLPSVFLDSRELSLGPGSS